MRMGSFYYLTLMRVRWQGTVITLSVGVWYLVTWRLAGYVG